MRAPHRVWVGCVVIVASGIAGAASAQTDPAPGASWRAPPRALYPGPSTLATQVAEGEALLGRVQRRQERLRRRIARMEATVDGTAMTEATTAPPAAATVAPDGSLDMAAFQQALRHPREAGEADTRMRRSPWIDGVDLPRVLAAYDLAISLLEQRRAELRAAGPGGRAALARIEPYLAAWREVRDGLVLAARQVEPDGLAWFESEREGFAGWVTVRLGWLLAFHEASETSPVGLRRSPHFDLLAGQWGAHPEVAVVKLGLASPDGFLRLVEQRAPLANPVPPPRP